MGMTPTPASSRSRLSAESTWSAEGPALRTSFLWTIKERDPKTGLFIPRIQRKNIQTNYGMTAYAGAFQGSYTAPVYLVIDQWNPQLNSLVGTTLVLVASRQPTLAGDTQLVLSIGTANQEVVSFTGSPTQNGSLWTYTLTAAPSLSHSVNDICVRNPLATDTMTAIFNEAQYDSVNAPNQRMQSIGGYSGGTANWVMQYFFTGTQALTGFNTVGLADNVNVGNFGNLHNLTVLGFQHTGTTNDLELDVSLTLSNV
jgi:hypothetical protein